MSRYTEYKGNNYFTIKDEDKFKALKKEYDYFDSLVHMRPPKEIGDKWICWFGYEDLSTDINHFHPDDVLDFWERLSEVIEEEIDFICLDEEFPILNDDGYACRLLCKNGKCEITNLKLIEVKENDI